MVNVYYLEDGILRAITAETAASRNVELLTKLVSLTDYEAAIAANSTLSARYVEACDRADTAQRELAATLAFKAELEHIPGNANDEIESIETQLQAMTEEMGVARRIVDAAKAYVKAGSGEKIDCFPEWLRLKQVVEEAPVLAARKHKHDYGVDEVGDIVRCQICGIPRALIVDDPQTTQEGGGGG